jgi:hypothetical protein
MDPVSDPLLLIKCGNVFKRAQDRYRVATDLSSSAKYFEWYKTGIRLLAFLWIEFLSTKSLLLTTVKNYRRRRYFIHK